LRKKVALAVLLISLLSIAFGFSRGEWRAIYNNGKILCLTCIGIK